MKVTTDWKIRDEWRDIDTRVFTPDGRFYYATFAINSLGSHVVKLS
jgi:hypothetical protein